MQSTSSDLKKSSRPTISHWPHRFFRAGAGAGKTTTLVREVIQLASSFQKKEGRLPRVVVTTFTRKATQELKERLLEEGIKSDEPSLLKFVTSPNSLMITTIHGILAKFLKQMSGSLGLDAEFRVVDQTKITRRWKSSLRKLLIQNPVMAELLERFTFVQLTQFARDYVLQAVTGEMPSLLTIEIIFENVRLQIAKFQTETERCLVELNPQSLSPSWSGLVEIIQRLHQSAQSVATLEQWSETRALWIELAENLSIPRGNARKEVSELACDSVKALKAEIEIFAEDDYAPIAWQQMAENSVALDEVGRQLATAWKQEKLESGELSIEDLEVLTLCLLKDQPDAAAQFSQHWDYWFVDEYQDTSPSQVILLKHLMGNAGQFVVGDPQQSIYFFRGARSEVFFQREKEFQANGVSTEILKTNRRSHPALLLFFNALFKTVSQDNFQDMDPDPSVELSSGPTHVARCFFLPDREQELDAIAWQIKKWRAQGVACKDIAVLTRTHKDLEDVAARIAADDIPLQIHASGGFFERREIFDAFALLRFLVNPKDDVNLLSLIRSPWLHISDLEITKRLIGRSATSAWMQMNAGAPIEAIQTLRKYLERSQVEGVSGIFQEALEDLGFFATANVYDSTGLREANLWKLILKLKEEEHRAGFSFVDFIARASIGIEDGLEQNDGDAVSAFEPNRVVLMTVHASKGLGIPYVIVPFIQKDLRSAKRETFLYDELENRWITATPSPDGSGWMYPPPMRNVVERIQNLEREEHLRLLYVALTRARNEVAITASGRSGKHSWRNAIKMDLSEGLHETEYFSYEVHAVVPEEIFAVKEKNTQAVLKVRPQWHSAVASNSSSAVASMRVNVTALVNEAARAEFEGGGGPKDTRHLKARVEAMRMGVRIHKLFELILRRRDLNVASLKLSANDPDLKLFETSLQFLLRQKIIPYRQLVENGFAEWGFAFLKDGLEVRGQIDLWGIVDGRLWIIDYKTGSSRSIEKAFIQMQVYGEALRAAGYLEKISTAAIFPLEEKIEVRNLN